MKYLLAALYFKEQRGNLKCGLISVFEFIKSAIKDYTEVDKKLKVKYKFLWLREVTTTGFSHNKYPAKPT